MSILGKILNTVTMGAVIEVEDPTPEAPSAQGVVSRPPATTPRAISTTPVTSSGSKSPDSVSDVSRTHAEKYMEQVLQNTPAKFQGFLAKKKEYSELLREGGTTDQSKIDTLATAKALKATKLSISDVNEASTNAKQALRVLVADFGRELEESRQSDVVDPTKSIQETEKNIQSLRSKIADLEKEIQSKESGIEPARMAIALAEKNLSHAQGVFQESCAIVEQGIATIESSITAAMQKKS